MSTVNIAPSVIRATAEASSKDMNRLPDGETLRAAAIHVEDSMQFTFPYTFAMHGFNWCADLRHLEDAKSGDEAMVAHVTVTCTGPASTTMVLGT